MIETKRLIIQPLTYGQLLQYAQGDNSLEAALQVHPTERTIAPALKEALEHTILPQVADTTKNYLYHTLWTAISKADNHMVGDLCFKGEPNDAGAIEIGYGTYEAFQGKGYMTEMVGGMIAWAKKQPGVKCITAVTGKHNIASFKVLQKNNFVQYDETPTDYYWKLDLSKRACILYIAMSLDGYIAQPNDDLGFLSMVAQEGEDYGYADFVHTVDTVIAGRKTYDKIMSMGVDFPHADKEVYIITRTPRQAEGGVQFYTGNLKALMEKLTSEPGKNIYCDGGAEIVQELLKDHLIDAFIISVIPILLGNGTKLFKDGRPEQTLQLVSVKSFDTGLVQLHYTRADNQAT